MHNIDIKARILNPNIETKITIPQFDSVKEAIKMMGEKHTLKILNDHAVSTSRISWNRRITEELFNK